jgi:hypothetical protein
MRTDYRSLTALLRPLISYPERITARADDDAQAAGLTVERVGRWRRCYRDPRMNSHAGGAANADSTSAADARKLISTPWSTPTLTMTAAVAGWSR